MASAHRFMVPAARHAQATLTIPPGAACQATHSLATYGRDRNRTAAWQIRH